MLQKGSLEGSISTALVSCDSLGQRVVASDFVFRGLPVSLGCLGQRAVAPEKVFGGPPQLFSTCPPVSYFSASFIFLHLDSASLLVYSFCFLK